MLRAAITGWAALMLTTSALHAQRIDPVYDTTLYHAMQWRNIGPFRGGRSVAVAGVTSDPNTYYFGGAGGGVWKTADAGESWRNISDGFFRTSSVGAITVAESDPNVIYVGMGEHAVRGVTTSHGDGIYRSTDAGKTWTHVGLERTRAISRIRVHPRDPDLVYVAAQGAPYGPTEDRGIYRSSDGGKTWEKILYVSETAGASDLSMNPSNPRVLYAAFWDHLRRPWVVRSGGEGSGIYKSTDGGDTWEQLTEGLPELMGKTSVAVSPANRERVWAIIEAERGGLYRSSDAGKTWRRVNSDRVLRARAWYYVEVFADPQDEETVYVLNAPVMKSLDGGRNFSRISTPHGDNHDLWINPTDNRILINANDGGANISFNGGRTWSSQRNQPTAQFYRVNTDNRFPYRVYGGQQDNSTVAIASRTADGSIDWKDWHAVGGCESAHVAFDPDDPSLVYAGCYQGQINEWDARTNTSRAIMAYPYLGLGMEPKDMRYRFNWNAPIVVSPHNPDVVYHAGNVLLRTQDRGMTWREISPDLTRDEEERQGAGGEPITNEGAGGEVYNTIMYVVESPHEAGTIWVGSDDGLVHLTRDAGANWADVTPDDMGEAMINAIEVSPHDPAAAYIAVTRYKFNDFTPHIYRTRDYGESWRRVVRGIDGDAWVRVVREDPVRRGLLYAGTETGVYVSFDDGDHWQSLQLNLPVTPITDLKIQDNDLVASTQGRAFWILDDLTPLHQIDDELAEGDTYLFEPRQAYLVGGGSAQPTNAGRNPPNGAVIYYYMSDVSDTVTIEILGPDGTVVRAYRSGEKPSEEESSTSEQPGQQGQQDRLSPKAGQNRLVWDLRHESLPRVQGLFVLGTLSGHRVPPGTYQVRLGVGEFTQTRFLEVIADPRFHYTPEEFARRDALLATIHDQVTGIHEGVQRIRDVRGQINGLLERVDGQAGHDSIAAAGRRLVERLTELEELLVQPEQKTFQDVINFPNRLNANLIYLAGVVEGTDPRITAGARQRLDDLSREWEQHRATLDRLLGPELDSWNAMVRDAEIPAVGVGTGS
ncbi:MAG: glycosyl hydrolase [Gemmatimonadetes bacterium]|nr:glycosyl hydrolase [Gemmatimonadota bacterium]